MDKYFSFLLNPAFSQITKFIVIYIVILLLESVIIKILFLLLVSL